MNYLVIAGFVANIRNVIAALSIAIVVKLCFPAAFSWWWLGCGLIVWLVFTIIIVVRYFDELSRNIEP